MEEYHELFSEDAEKKRIHCLIYGAQEINDRTTTCIRLSPSSIDAEVKEYVSGEAKDANLMFTGEHIKERVLDIDTGFIFDYEDGK